jgi:pectinesterase inhibitor-like protein
MLNFFSFLLVSILLLQSFPHGSADEQYITSVCQNTTLPEACRSILLSDPRSREVSDKDSLVLIAFDIAINSSNSAYEGANNLRDQYSGKPQYGPLIRCSRIYMDMVTELSEGKAKVDNKLYKEANELAFDAQTKPDACDSEFISRNMEDLLLQDNHDLTTKCAVSASLALYSNDN